MSMASITIRRAFNLGNFETVSVEVTGEGVTLEEARLCANKDLLMSAQQEMTRIANARVGNVNNNPLDQVSLELQIINQQLSTL